MTDWQLTRTYRGGAGTIRWDRFGDPDAEPVVLLHGTPFSSFIWRGFARGLAGVYDTYVWDMPGYGLSEMTPDQDLSLAALGRAFAELLDHWGLSRPRVVAHDSGGAVALGAHLLHGVRYRRLALVDAVALAPWGSPFFQVVGEHARVFDRLPAALHRAVLREYVNTASSPGLHPVTLEALIRPWLTEEGQEAFYRQLTARRQDERYTDTLRPRLADVAATTLVCWGADDTWIPPDRGRELAALLPDARLRVIPGAGHLSPEDQPAELATTLTTFLAASDD
ncbi:alpha/beta hydrolase [Streptomyces sp. B6B3]|uniref:alpha/beta fold hydrolase n=1 Tax=Streptomyces sp. B6B3 TaxID=3153570 RepID=UPI00325DCE66